MSRTQIHNGLTERTLRKRARRARPERPLGLAWGRWLGDFEPLTAAEQRLVECCAKGTSGVERVSDSRSSEDGQPEENNGDIRAEVIRFLALGGDANNPVHFRGIAVQDATITGQLDLCNCKVTRKLELEGCTFTHTLLLDGARIPELSLAGSTVPALSASHLQVKGTLWLDEGFCAHGLVNLKQARIGGNLQCSDARFLNPGGIALSADRAGIKGTVSFKRAVVKGEVSLISATIDGSVDFVATVISHPDNDACCFDRAIVRGSFFLKRSIVHGTVRMVGAEIGGNFICSGALRNSRGFALILQNVDITRTLFWQPSECIGQVDLKGSRAATLNDKAPWPEEAYVLDGLRYNQIMGSHNAVERIAWLQRQRPDQLGSEDFAPQPWEQLAKVLREMGHTGEAAEVSIAKQDAMRAAGRIGQRQTREFPDSIMPPVRNWIDRCWNPVSNTLTRVWHYLYGGLSGYGYRPQRILYLLAGMIALSSFAYYEGRHDGLIGPNDERIMLSETTQMCGTGGDPGVVYWTDPECPIPPEYSTFQPFLYTLDITLPLVDLHQEAQWGPIVVDRRGEYLWGGRFLRWLMWFNILSGWVASLMFVAIVSRLVEKD